MHHLSYDNTENDILWLDAAYLASMQMTHSIMRYLLGGSQDLPLLSSDLDKIVYIIIRAASFHTLLAHRSDALKSVSAVLLYTLQ
jgi:hypothetical protein